MCCFLSYETFASDPERPNDLQSQSQGSDESAVRCNLVSVIITRASPPTRSCHSWALACVHQCIQHPPGKRTLGGSVTRAVYTSERVSKLVWLFIFLRRGRGAAMADEPMNLAHGTRCELAECLIFSRASEKYSESAGHFIQLTLLNN